MITNHSAIARLKEYMNLRTELGEAAAAGLLQHEQLAPLIEFLEKRRTGSATARFTGAHILYYLGGLLAIGAMTLFTTLAVEAMGMGVLLALSLVYIVVAILAAEW